MARHGAFAVELINGDQRAEGPGLVWRGLAWQGMARFGMVLLPYGIGGNMDKTICDDAAAAELEEELTHYMDRQWEMATRYTVWLLRELGYNKVADVVNRRTAAERERARVIGL
jgi:hypothetical protein